MRTPLSAALVCCSFLVPVAAQAGCLTGAAVGGVVGHVAGHHAVLGAAAGCAIGHHDANVQNDKQQAAQGTNQNQAPTH
jgi:hypothetical protein